MRPTPFYVQVTLGLPGGEEVDQGLPVQHRYEGDIFSGEKRTELLVVPALSVRVTPEIAIIPAASIRPASAGAPAGGAGSRATAAARRWRRRRRADREVRVTVVNDAPGPADSVVKLELPPGWTASPAAAAREVRRDPDESQTVRFQVRPAPNTAPGEFQVRAVASANGRTFDRGFQVIEYPHIRRYHIYDTAHTTLKVIDVRTPANLLIGYVMGVGDQVPTAIEQLGAKVEMITADELAWGNLSRFDAIVTGVRAYERRADLRANNSRLLEYVFNGGTAIVQYNKFEFNDAQYGPYPAKVSSNRVTDADAPGEDARAQDPVFTTPNEIGEAAWKNWVQERGLYFLGEKDSRYRDLVQLEDPFPQNPGPKTGALVKAQYGKGRWVYVGTRSVAAAAVGHRRRLSVARQPDLARQERARAESDPIADCDKSTIDPQSAICSNPQFMEVPLTPLEFARRSRALYPDREAVVDGALRLTYAQFFDRCDRWSSALQALGVKPGDRVAYIAPNTHAQLESFYAVPQIGAVLVPINYRLSPGEFAYIINHSGATVVCAHEDYLEASTASGRSCRASGISSRSKAFATDGSTTKPCSARRRRGSSGRRSKRAISSPSTTRAAPRRGRRA